ncbi:hypothetical protein CCHL11_04727 [Colletotrichum chlorophyti]|uniref:Uncharacterized protein n=1 Tax=Colletotrichum chlorophyti TaxID=708187 RepID=A0A1Q8S1S6_9PEZI|nr:hypothetical protein CCHL11_04727 [Colletotrichum chlorophyti]
MDVMSANGGKSSLGLTGSSPASATSRGTSNGFSSSETTAAEVHRMSSTDHGDFTTLSIVADTGRVPQLPLVQSWDREVELMHHYCTCTCDTLALREDMRHVWRVEIPREGYLHPYVMHGILALSASHKAYLISSQREAYLTMSAYHQSLGLEAFRPVLTSITKNNWKPVFCYSSLLTTLACLLPMRSDNGRLSAPITEVLEMFRFVRGVRSVLQPFFEYLPRSNFAPLAQGAWIAPPGELSDLYVVTPL